MRDRERKRGKDTSVDIGVILHEEHEHLDITVDSRPMEADIDVYAFVFEAIKV